MLLYPCIVILSDLTTRFLGSEKAHLIIWRAWCPALVLSMMIGELRIACASIFVYFISQQLDIYIFSKVRHYCSSLANIDRVTWVWPPLISAVFSQALDTYLFYSVAFIESNDIWMSQHWFEIASMDYLFKLIVIALFLLPIYRACLKNLSCYFDAHYLTQSLTTAVGGRI